MVVERVWILVAAGAGLFGLLCLVVAVFCFRSWRAAREDAAFALALVDAARADALAAEARSRNVGGTGEHEGVIVIPFDPVSRVGTMFRDPRFDIPGQGRSR